ncbi:MAG: hypothetical protein OEY01_03725 [Desulfobulbaceae bacterium]|nr:hypothetical protein [Desulfobulbaceae bacterium]
MSLEDDIKYLRSRVRWTQKLEDELKALHAKGEPPNMMEFGVPDGGSEAMKKALDRKARKD